MRMAFNPARRSDLAGLDRLAMKWGAAMQTRTVLAALVVLTVISGPVRAQESLVAHKSLSPEIALDLARAALADCQRRGYQVAVAVVDRFGIPQVMLRDRFAGPHTPATATGKAWTAASFRTNTTELLAISQPGMMQAGIRNLPGAVILGGGMVVQSGGSLVGAVGVSGAPGAMPTMPAPRPASPRFKTSSIFDDACMGTRAPRRRPSCIATSRRC